jgi:16S rRNA (uracil1498-N3)-methyltransferase
MRACFQEDLKLQDSYQLKGDAAHHLISVLRIEIHEEVLLLNGAGLSVKTKVSSLTKKEIFLVKIDSDVAERKLILDLALGIPKKEALELCLKQAVELGFRKLYLVRAQYSQTRLPETERLKSLLVSALEQSNAPFLPELIYAAWEEIPTSEYNEILMMDSQNKSQNAKKAKSLQAKLLIVGPEGGFAPEETSFIYNMPNIRILNLPTPILRTPTAVSTGAGILLGSLLD